MRKQVDMRALALLLEYIPIEMYWAYEAVRRSGLYNMLCFHPIGNRYHISDPKEVLNVIDTAYVKFCAYNNADISDKKYVHVTRNHIAILQEYYDLLLTYFEPMPEGVVNINKTTTITYE